MNQFESLLFSVLKLEPNALSVIADYVEESGKNRETIVNILNPFVIFGESIIGNELIYMLAFQSVKRRWDEVAGNYQSSEDFPELPKDLPVLFISELIRRYFLPELQRLRNMVPTTDLEHLDECIEPLHVCSRIPIIKMNNLYYDLLCDNTNTSKKLLCWTVLLKIAKNGMEY